MSKPTLVIEKREFNNNGRTRGLGMKELLHFLHDSDLFDISFHDDKIRAAKCQMGTLLYYQDKKVYLDVWEYQTPTYTSQVIDANLDLIIKLQNKPIPMNTFHKFCRRKGIFQDISKEERETFRNKIVPWTFFASRLMMKWAGKEEELPDFPIEQEGFFCGKVWKNRIKMKAHMEAEGVEYTKSSQEVKSGRPLTDEEYLRKMGTSKYGIVLAGRGSLFAQGKNRREIDYMMLKKPLLLNYDPYYYDPLVDGTHYIKIDEKTSFKDLEMMYNIEEIAKNGYEWYKRNASPMGAAKSFLRIMNDKFGE